jgi:glycosyltransferase involved in cell wall biosynthesis
VLAVSRLDRLQKRLHKLVEAFAMIAARHPEWDLLIIGDGPEEAALRRLAVARGISARVRLQRSAKNICKAYVESQLFAIPSYWEGFPNALAEALAHGLPAVGFREAPGVAQLITNGETGWLAEGLDSEEKLAEALDEAMANGAERARRAANGARSMAVRTPDAEFDRWANLIRSVTEKV